MKKILLFTVILGSLFGIGLYAYDKNDKSAVATAKKYISAWNNQDLDTLDKLGRYGYKTERFKRVYEKCLLEKGDKQRHIDNLTNLRKEFEPEFEYKVGYYHTIINEKEDNMQKEIYDFIDKKKYTKADYKLNDARTTLADDYDLEITQKAVDVGDFIIRSILGNNYKTNLTPYEYRIVCLFLGFRYVNNVPVNKSVSLSNQIFKHIHYSQDPKHISLRKSCLNESIETKEIDHINFIEEKKPAPDKSIVRLELILKDKTSYKLAITLSLVDGKWLFVDSDRWLPSYQ